MKFKLTVIITNLNKDRAECSKLANLLNEWKERNVRFREITRVRSYTSL